MRGFPVSRTGMEKRPTKLVTSVITRAGHLARYLWPQLLARIYGVFALKCSLVRQVAIISPPAMQLRILHKSAIYVGRSVLRGGRLSIAANAAFSPSAAPASQIAAAALGEKAAFAAIKSQPPLDAPPKIYSGFVKNSQLHSRCLNYSHLPNQTALERKHPIDARQQLRPQISRRVSCPRNYGRDQFGRPLFHSSSTNWKAAHP